MEDSKPVVSNSVSKVGERLTFLRGRKVRVRLTYAEQTSVGSETFQAVYEDCIPAGRVYFFVFDVSGRKRLVQTSHLVEVEEIT